jgi:hypothetical protein
MRIPSSTPAIPPSWNPADANTRGIQYLVRRCLSMTRTFILHELRSAWIPRRLVSLRIKLDGVPSVDTLLVRCIWCFLLKRIGRIHEDCVWMDSVPGASPKSSTFNFFLSCVCVVGPSSSSFTHFRQNACATTGAAPSTTPSSCLYPSYRAPCSSGQAARGYPSRCIRRLVAHLPRVSSTL